MPQYVNIPMPLQFKRQFNKAPYSDMTFDTTANRIAYLTSPRRYGGMQVTDKELEQCFYLNTAEDTWLSLVPPGGLGKGLGSVETTITFDGSATKGQVGGGMLFDIEVDIPIGSFIAFAFIDVVTTLVSDDNTSFITLGIQTDDEVAILNSSDQNALVTQLNTNIVTGIINPALTKASDNRILVGEIGGSNITAGSLKLTIVISDLLIGSGGGGTDTNFATDDLTFTGNRTHNLNGNSLVIGNTAPYFILDNGQVILQAYNSTGDGNRGRFIGNTTDTEANFTVKADFNDGVSIAAVTGRADATTNGLTYTGQLHQFTGGLILNEYTGIGTHVGTTVKLLAVDSSGNVIESERTGVPGGNNTQLQWNDNGVFGGTSDGVYDEHFDIFQNRYGLGYFSTAQLPNTKLALKGTSIGLSEELVLNNLSVDGTDWTFGTGWTYNAGSHVAVHAGPTTGTLSYPGTVIAGATYQVEWDQAGGSGTVVIGGTGIFNGTGHQLQQLTAVNTGGGNLISFVGVNSSIINVTNVSVKRVITSSLIAQGNVSFQQGLNMAIKEIAIDYNMAAEDITIVAKDGCTTIDLPDGTSVGFGAGHILLIKNFSSLTITINAFSGQQIDISPTMSLLTGSCGIIQWSGTGWIIVSIYIP